MGALRLAARPQALRPSAQLEGQSAGVIQLAAVVPWVCHQREVVRWEHRRAAVDPEVLSLAAECLWAIHREVAGRLEHPWAVAGLAAQCQSVGQSWVVGPEWLSRVTRLLPT